MIPEEVGERVIQIRDCHNSIVQLEQMVTKLARSLDDETMHISINVRSRASKNGLIAFLESEIRSFSADMHESVSELKTLIESPPELTESDECNG
jgi:hypothetical protein